MTTWHTVHVRVNDASTGQPTPVRIRLSQGKRTFAPLGRSTAFATGRGQDLGGHLRLNEASHFFIDGTCEVRLPSGNINVEISKGPEYLPVRNTVSLTPGQISLRLTVQRSTDLRNQGWYSGDTRAMFVSPHAALLEAAAEDLAVVNLLACADRPGVVSNLLAFSGQRPCLESPGHLVVVNTLNHHPVLGTLGLLNCHRVVYPLGFGGVHGLDNWSLADWCDQCHRKGGLVVWSDTPTRKGGRLPGEALADLILGKVDAFEVSSLDDPKKGSLPDWYRLLNAGLRMPLVGGSGKDSNAVALGRVRTYAQLPTGEPLTYRAWIEAVRAGRTYVTNGPLWTFSVDDHGPGSLLEVTQGKVVRIGAEARGLGGVGTVELIANGKVIFREDRGDPEVFRVLIPWQPAASGWIAARCWSHERRPDGTKSFAQTSPIYVNVGGQPLRPATSALVQALLGPLDRTAAWVRRQARCNDQQREHLTAIFRDARQELLRRASSDA